MVEKRRTKARGWRRPTKEEAALRRRSTEVPFAHKNQSGVLEVACGDQAVCAVEIAVQLHELVAQVSTPEESYCPHNWAESFGFHMANRPLKVVNASGGRLEHFSSRDASFNPEKL